MYRTHGVHVCMSMCVHHNIAHKYTHTVHCTQVHTYRALHMHTAHHPPLNQPVGSYSSQQSQHAFDHLCIRQTFSSAEQLFDIWGQNPVYPEKEVSNEILKDLCFMICCTLKCCLVILKLISQCWCMVGTKILFSFIIKSFDYYFLFAHLLLKFKISTIHQRKCPPHSKAT